VVLVDTSIWVEHLRQGVEELRSLLLRSQVCCHPFVIGELACGQLRNRSEILSLLASLHKAALLEEEEVLEFVETNKLHGRGVGWIDVHLLSSALLTGVPLWTLDRQLKEIAAEFKLAY